VSSEAAEIVRIRREDRPEGGLSRRSRWVSRAIAVAPDDWARAFNVYVSAGQVAGRTDSAESTIFASAHAHRRQQAWILEEVPILAYWLSSGESTLEGSFARLTLERAWDARPEQPDSERELNLYKEELKRIRSEQGDQNQQARERRKSSSAYLDEAIALAHPIALRLLGWLHARGKLDLGRVFDVFGKSPSTFEGIARLHLIGALKFDDGELTITSLGSRVLSEFDLIGSDDTTGSEASASS
jgi:hypothetical protein